MTTLQNIDNIITIFLAVFFSFKLIHEIKNKKRFSLITIFLLISIHFIIKAFFVISITFGW